jgi:hypothetical protein
MFDHEEIEEIFWMPQIDKRIASTCNDQPSVNQDAHWIFHSPHNSISTCFAKFILFYEVDLIDEMWKKAKDAIDNKLFSDHILYISCSTALSQQRQISPRIILNVFDCVDIPQLEQIGCVIVDYMNYQSSSGYLYCKMTSKTIRVKCKECKDMQLFDLQERCDWEIDGYKSNVFQIDYKYKDFAKSLGSEWDISLKRWISPTLKVWKQMIKYFPQV